MAYDRHCYVAGAAATSDANIHAHQTAGEATTSADEWVATDVTAAEVLATAAEAAAPLSAQHCKALKNSNSTHAKSGTAS